MGHSFRLLEQLYGDRQARSIWSAANTIDAWLRAEAALARAQARVGLICEEDAVAIEDACDPARVDQDRLWEAARNVGYPILGLVRDITERLPPGPDGRVHFGATTQDIMDTALALQLVQSCDHLLTLLTGFGDALAVHVTGHERSVMAARTHGQQAVPTTFGAKMATYLTQVTDGVLRVRDIRERVAVVSLHGAGGTNAAMGTYGADVRRHLADLLGLHDSRIPGHVTRHHLVDLAMTCGLLATICVRFAREVIDLARNEIAEVTEQRGHHRGASSTMPQKANPITAESIVGFGIASQAEGTGLLRVIEAGHERSAGEWQAEWVLVPQVIEHTASALNLAGELTGSLVVDPDAMRRNLAVDGGLLMSEAVMMWLAPALGREQAHDAVYAAAHSSRQSGAPLATALVAVLGDHVATADIVAALTPENYLGEAQEICTAAVDRWTATATTERTSS